MATTDGGVNLRYDATTDSGIICLIPDCVKLHISGESSNGWGYTEYNGVSDRIAMSEVKDYVPEPEEENTDEEPEEDTEITDTETDDNTDSFATIIYILIGLIIVILATAAVIIIRLLKK